MTVIAIDGPAGAGKSTVGRAVARELGLGYLDTGAMYRAVTFAAMRRGYAPADPAHAEGIAEVAATVDYEVSDVDGRTRVEVDGHDVSYEVRRPRLSRLVSAVAANSDVRRELVARQRAWVAKRGGAVVEGRDIGSVVFPDADLKLYVTASPRVRAERRVAELGGDLASIEAAIVERDRQDSSRADSPLAETPDAVVVDTSDMTIEEVVAQIVGMME